MKDLFPPENKKDTEFLKQFIKNKKIITKNFGDIFFDEQIWDAGPLDNRSWLWTLHSFCSVRLFDCCRRNKSAETTDR